VKQLHENDISVLDVYNLVCDQRSVLQDLYGERLPSEQEFAEYAGCDRFTARRALSKLVEAGILHKVRNKGYFFELPKTEVKVSGSTSYHQFCKINNLEPRIEIIDRDVQSAGPEIAGFLGTESQTQVWNLLFLRYVGAIPFSLTRSWVGYERMPGLMGHLLAGKSLHKTFSDHYGIQPRRRSTTCSAHHASRAEAKLLDLPLSFALLKACSLVLDQHGTSIEYCETLYRGDMVSLTFNVAGGEL